MRRFLTLAALTAATTLALAGTSSAATQVGEAQNTVQNCMVGATFVQDTSGHAPLYSVPAGGGVITSWSMYAGPATGQQVKFKVFRPTGTAHEYEAKGDSNLETLTPNQLNTFSTRIPVQAGWQIGFYEATGLDRCYNSASGDAGDSAAATTGDQAVGTTQTFPQLSGGGYRMDIQANVEPDADGDGFGDETQDKCSTDPTTQDVCQADLSITKAADKAAVKKGASVTYTIAVKDNSSYNTAKSAVVDDTLPSNVSFTSATGATCGAGAPGHVSCSLGDIAKGETKTLTIVVTATTAGTATDTATVASSTPDPNSGNNSASASTVVPATPALSLPNQSVTVGSNRIAMITESCGATVFGSCTGTLVDKTASKVVVARKKRILTLGSTTFTIQPGKTVKVPLKLSKKAYKLLKQKGKLKTIAKATIHDGVGTTNVRTAKVTLKAKKKKH